VPDRWAYSAPRLHVYGDVAALTRDPTTMPDPSQKCADPGDGDGNAPVVFCSSTGGGGFSA
jgi:hypothetical protein